MNILKNKKASAGSMFFQNWAEIFFFILLVLGFIISISVGNRTSAVIAYITILLCGVMAGRLIFERKHKMKFPYFLIIIGFLIGYLIGARYGDKRVMVILFFLGAIIGFQFRNKGLISDTRF